MSSPNHSLDLQLVDVCWSCPTCIKPNVDGWRWYIIHVLAREDVFNENESQRFISFTSDYGFKATFGNENNSIFLRKALQALIASENAIVEVNFDKNTIELTFFAFSFNKIKVSFNL